MKDKETEKITVFKADWQDFLKWCGKEEFTFDSLEDLGALIDLYIIEALRIKTKYVN